MQTRCTVKGEAQKSPLYWQFSGGFWFSEERLFSKNSRRKPLNLINSPIFTNTPCKSSFLYNAPSVHTVEGIPKNQGKEGQSAPNMTGRRFHRTTEAIPCRPWKSKSPFASRPMKISIKKGDARGAREVRRGTSSIHFRRAVPGSSSHMSYWSPRLRNAFAPYRGQNPQNRGKEGVGVKNPHLPPPQKRALRVKKSLFSL